MARFNKNNYRKLLKEEDKKYAALRREQQKAEKKKLKRQRNIFLKIKEAQKKNEKEQEAIEKEQESRKDRLKDFSEKSINSAKKAKNKFRSNVKKAKKGKLAKNIARFFIPGILINLFVLLIFFIAFEVYAGGIVGTIAGLANPQQRAILEAKGIIGDKDVTTIPAYLIGDEPDLKGSNGSLSNSSTSGAGEAGNKIGDNDPAEEVFVKVARVVGEAIGVQPRLIFGQMCVEVGGPKFTSQAKEDKNLSGLTYPIGKDQGATRGQARGINGCEGGVYSKFPTWEAYEKAYEDTLVRLFGGKKPQSATDYAQILGEHHYFTGDGHGPGGGPSQASINSYGSNIEKFAKEFDELNKKYPETKGSSSNSGNNNNNGNNSGATNINNLPEGAKFIFQHESSMNIHADNGNHYGLGQLIKSYYQTYIGKPWNETNEQDQIEAATKYMKERYNTWEKAEAFWKANHWW